MATESLCKIQLFATAVQNFPETSIVLKVYKYTSINSLLRGDAHAVYINQILAIA